MTSVAVATSPLQILLPHLICFAMNRSLIRDDTKEDMINRIAELDTKVQELQLKLDKTTQENLKLNNEVSLLRDNITRTQNELQKTSETEELKLNEVEGELKEVIFKCNNTETQLVTTELKLNESAQKVEYANHMIEALLPNRGLLLTEAMGTGNISLILPLIELGAPVNVPDSFGFIPAFWAISDGEVDAVELLLKAGTDPNTPQGEENDALLHISARNGDIDIVKKLLEFKANPNYENKYQNTPLHEAAFFGHEKVVRALLDNNAKVDPQNYKKATPLLFAAAKGHLPIVQLLVQKGADRNVRNHAGRTPQEEAQHRGKQRVSWWLGKQK